MSKRRVCCCSFNDVFAPLLNQQQKRQTSPSFGAHDSSSSKTGVIVNRPLFFHQLFRSLFYVKNTDCQDMEQLMNQLENIRIPTSSDRIHKDECVFSFDTPVSKMSSHSQCLMYLLFRKRKLVCMSVSIASLD